MNAFAIKTAAVITVSASVLTYSPATGRTAPLYPTPEPVRGSNANGTASSAAKLGMSVRAATNKAASTGGGRANSWTDAWQRELLAFSPAVEAADSQSAWLSQIAVMLDRQVRLRLTDGGLSSVIRLEDPLEARFDAIERLSDGWDGAGSLAPAAQAVHVLHEAALRLSAGRAIINPSPHPDGYINVEWYDDRTVHSVELYADRAEYMTHNLDSGEFEESVGSLDEVELASFLQSADIVD